jgi:hypothetical protein
MYSIEAVLPRKRGLDGFMYILSAILKKLRSKLMAPFSVHSDQARQSLYSKHYPCKSFLPVVTGWRFFDIFIDFS